MAAALNNPDRAWSVRFAWAAKINGADFNIKRGSIMKGKNTFLTKIRNRILKIFIMYK